MLLPQFSLQTNQDNDFDFFFSLFEFTVICVYIEFLFETRRIKMLIIVNYEKQSRHSKDLFKKLKSICFSPNEHLHLLYLMHTLL